MKITQTFLTKNNCYTAGRKINVKGIMVHSTACPGVKASNFIKSWNTPQPNGRSVCVHAFIDDTGIYQTLPWNHRGWHSGGTANDSYIGFEICEPKNYADQEYFEKTKELAKKLCVYLCQEFNLEPKVIITHCEGYSLKGKAFASNHSDIYHWWKKYFNYTMDDFRKEVLEELERNDNMEFKTGTEALDYLVEKGRINTKEHWIAGIQVVKFLDELFIKWAKDVAKLHENQ